MLKFLNRKFPGGNFPTILTHTYYFMISFTLCYVYYHKFITRADFYGTQSTGGIYAVLNFESVRPIQYRLFIPYIFSILKSIVSVFTAVNDKALFFIITIFSCYLVLLAFYFLLNQFFKSRAMNSWIAPVIIYPMIWNFVILNGQFFFMDFPVLLFIVAGFYCIVSERNYLLLITFIFGVLNHPSAGYLILVYLLYNYKRLFKPKTIIYTAIMSVVYLGTYRLLDRLLPPTEGYFIIFNLPRNLQLIYELPVHIQLRDLVFNFGGLHIFVVAFFITGAWKRFRGPLLYSNFVIIPYVISVLMMFSLEEMRNYIAIIPFVVILALLFLSSFENSFLRPVERFYVPWKKE